MLLAETTSPDRRRVPVSDKAQGLARTKSVAPAATARNLVKWSSKESVGSQAKSSLQKRASRESSVVSESPGSSVTGMF